MLITNFQHVQEFAQALKDKDVDKYSRDSPKLYKKLIEEEYTEVIEELLKPEINRVALASELADLLYTVYLTAVNYNIPIDKVFLAVHKANMTKIKNGIFNEHGKLIKPADYIPANVHDIIYSSKAQNSVNEYYLVFDGGNGGASTGLGYGSYIIRTYNRHGDIVINNSLDYSDHGGMTNNDAEYHTLYRALIHFKMKLIEDKQNLKDITIHIEGDSELVRNQIGRFNKNGWDGWKCNLLRLKNYRDEIRTLLSEFKSFTYEHVSREYIVSVLGH